jgi:DNA-binding LytR/AlgR family response regulator
MRQNREIMLHIAICDDNIDELSNMVRLIGLYKTSKNVDFEYATFPNGIELMAALEKGMRFDIYCLDIMMPRRKSARLIKPRGFCSLPHRVSML